MQVISYKEKYERKKYAYYSLLKDYNELAENYRSFKEIVVNSLENLKEDEQADLYDIGYNSGIEESIAVVSDMNVPLCFEAEKPSFLLTRLEYEILKWLIDKDYKYIARDSGGGLYVYYEQPPKKDSIWGGALVDHFSICDFRDLFHFVKWEDKEPMNIEELLNNCEVLEND